MKQRIKEYLINNTMSFNEEQFNLYYDSFKEFYPEFENILQIVWIKFFEPKHIYIFQNSFFNVLKWDFFPDFSEKFVQKDQVRRFLLK